MRKGLQLACHGSQVAFIVEHVFVPVVKDVKSSEALIVVLSVVELITALGDWISITLLMEEGGLLLQLLIQMLSLTGDVTVQLSAAECLLAISGRKVWYFCCIYSG